MEKLVGRETEIKLLKEYTSSERPEFVAIYGRRRVGKTYLVNHLFKVLEKLVQEKLCGQRSSRHTGFATECILQPLWP